MTLLTSSSSPQPVRRAISAMKSVSEIVLSREQEVGRGVFEQHAPAERLLRLVDVVGDRREGLLRIGQRQEIVEEALVVARPGQMLREQAGLVALGERGQALEMVLVERPGRADGEADAVQGEGIERADRLQPAVRRAAVAHIVFGVDFEKSEIGPLGENLLDVIGFQADAAAAGQGRGDARAEGRRNGHRAPPRGSAPPRVFASVFAAGAPHVTGRSRPVCEPFDDGVRLRL